MLKDLYGYDFQTVFKQDALDMMENQKICINFVKQFKILWSQNGDNISQHYAGTNALTSHATKTGSGGLFGKLRGKLSSIKRLYEGTFQDSHKQEAIDLILGRHMDSQRSLKFEEDLKEEAFRRESQYLHKKQVSVYILTWNIKKFLPKNTHYSLKNILDFQSYKAPDILVFCLQKKPEYKTENLDTNCSDKTERQFWIQLLQNNIFALDLPEYVEVDFHSSGGMLTIILAQKSIIEDITAVEHDDIISTSVGKGTVVIKMNVCDTKLCFINAHLQQGVTKAQERYQQINEIHQKTFQKEGMSKYKREKIEKSDKIFLIGNLNFRVNMEFNESMRHITKLQDLSIMSQADKIRPVLQYYLGYDQLLLSKKGVVSNYQEAPINFLPTYKYAPQSIKYDIQKERSPSWVDRILMWNNEQNVLMKNQQLNQELEIEPAFLPFNALINTESKQNIYREGLPLFYNRKENDISDHRPVSAYYIVTVKDEDLQKKDKIFKDLVSKKICQGIAQDQRNSNNEFWQQDDEENAEKNGEGQSVQVLNAMQNQQFDESEDEEDDEDEDIQGEYDKQQEQQYYMDQTKLNHTTKPKYKYSEDYSDMPDQVAALNFSNNIDEGKLKNKNNKMRFKNAVDSALKSKKFKQEKSQENDLFLTKYPSEKESIFQSKTKYQSDFQRNKLYNDPQFKSEVRVSQVSQDQSIHKLLNSSIQISTFRKSNDAAYDPHPGQLTLQKFPSNIQQTRYSDQIKLTSNDRLVKEQGTESMIKKKIDFPLIQNSSDIEGKHNQSSIIKQKNTLLNSDPVDSKKEEKQERESSFFFVEPKNNLNVPQDQLPQKKYNSDVDINQMKSQNHRKMSEGNQQQQQNNQDQATNGEKNDVSQLSMITNKNSEKQKVNSLKRMSDIK